MQKSLQFDYVLEDFCDVYSQSLVYGLLMARLETEPTVVQEVPLIGEVLVLDKHVQKRWLWGYGWGLGAWGWGGWGFPMGGLGWWGK